jgi:diguanylate cyclase (GGDEF)-like protein
MVGRKICAKCVETRLDWLDCNTAIADTAHMELGWGSAQDTSQPSSRRPDSGHAALVPYAVCLVIAYALIPFQQGVDWREVGPALALQLLVAVFVAVEPGTRLDRWRIAGPIAIVLYLISVALLRDGGGPTAGYGPLALLPVIWASLRGRRDELAVAVIGVAVIYIVPALVIGPPLYAHGSARAGILFAVISGTLGIAVLQLVSRVQALLDQQTSLAQTDELTGLPNRRAWQELLTRELSVSKRLKRPVAVALLDLDFFKRFNDTHGHLAGDRLLLLAAAAWHGALRDGDVLARWGGDEFGLLLPGCNAIQALEVVDRLRLAAPDLPFSAGVAGWRPGTTTHELVEAADDALYSAKQGERNRSAVAPS